MLLLHQQKTKKKSVCVSITPLFVLEPIFIFLRCLIKGIWQWRFQHFCTQYRQYLLYFIKSIYKQVNFAREKNRDARLLMRE